MNPQGADKMSTGTFTVDPELRAYLEAVFAKYAKPGVCNPADPTPTVDGDPNSDAVERDRAPPGNATMTRSKPSAGQPWPPDNSATIVGFRSPPSSP